MVFMYLLNIYLLHKASLWYKQFTRKDNTYGTVITVSTNVRQGGVTDTLAAFTPASIATKNLKEQYKDIRY